MNEQTNQSTTIAKIVWAVASVIFLAAFVTIVWGLSYSTGGDRYDEQAAFFLKGIFGLAAVGSLWRAIA